jgi:CheY-like chemotaxis protein
VEGALYASLERNGHFHKIIMATQDNAEPRSLVPREGAARHLAILQTLTSALSGAATPAEVARIVAGEMSAAVGSDRTALLVGNDEGRLRLLASDGLSHESERPLPLPAADPPLPLLAAFREGTPFWLSSPREIAASFPALREPALKSLAALPLQGADRHRVGAILFGFHRPDQLTAARRALLEDLARQVSLSVERSLLFERIEEADRAQHDFIATLGHELRNPLSPILTALELMRLRGGGSGLEPERSVIERQVCKLARLVDDLLDAPRAGRRPPASRPLAPAEGTAPPGPTAKKEGRILVVDDNRDAADGLMLALEDLGYSVRAAYDAPSALAAARDFSPQLALVDIGLPVMDGYELATRLREQTGTALPGLVAITGYGQETDRVRSQEAGFSDHLVKPVNIAQVQAVVGRTLASSSRDVH